MLKSAMAGERLDHVDRVGALRRRLQREPFVEDQAVVAVALRRSRRTRPRAPARRGWPAPSARPGGRSYCRRRHIAPWPAPRRDPDRRPPAAPAPPTSAGERPWPRATGRSPARTCACARASSSASAAPTARRSASRLAWIASGSTSSIRSPISAFGRQGQRLALERRVERVGAQRAAHRGDDRRRDRPPRPARRRSARGTSVPGSAS